MNRNSLLYKAEQKRRHEFSMNPEFTAVVMKRIVRRQKMRQVWGLMAAIVSLIGAVGVGIYYLLPSIREIHVSFGIEILPAIILAALLCLLLLVDSIIRHKFFAENFPVSE